MFRLVILTFAFWTTSGGRLGDFARNRGYNPKLVTRANGGVRSDSPQNFRFLSQDTEAFRVKSLPDIPFDVDEMYAGNIPTNTQNSSRSLYFVFQPKFGNPVDEITIWLNGGPGCSSLEGFFQENGPFSWGYGQYSPTINPYSWVNLTNMLWVEQPVGTGFSVGEVTAMSQEDIAKDFTDFLLNFEKIFGIKKFKIYVTGESYAGRYVPYISAAILDRNDTDHFDLKGALMYDPCIGSFEYAQQEVPTLPFVLKNNNILGLNDSYLDQLEELDEKCGYADFRDQYLSFPPDGVQLPKFFNHTSDLACDIWGQVNNAAWAPNPCFNVYQIGTQCPLLSDPLGLPTGLQYSYSGQPIYFNRTDVKKAMNAPVDVSWQECSNGAVFLGSGGPESEGDISPDPIQSVLPRVIEATNRVLISNADLDMEIITDGTLLAIQNMTWNGDLGFQNKPCTPIVITLPDLQYAGVFAANTAAGLDDPQGTMGVQHYERGLMWAETYLAGHMQPQFQPRSAYRHLQWVLGHIETL
ncbi:hypothetical protein G7Y89_g178 [Cudoniella acicularis]|uniref:Carboxypeptidase n=1 Tax=Cudoniella acicularis TaxID=354080 RepID=A0A8H4S0D6_9HELO|nr:hypothetical protein G7Y89_g178 [Cudoniella acicularis]